MSPEELEDAVEEDELPEDEEVELSEPLEDAEELVDDACAELAVSVEPDWADESEELDTEPAFCCAVAVAEVLRIWSSIVLFRMVLVVDSLPVRTMTSSQASML